MKKAVKLVALTLALALFMSAAVFTVSAETEGFTDVETTDYFYDAVRWGTENGITSGVGDDLFAPNGYVTRAQVVTFLWRMAGEPVPEEKTSTFSDVEAGAWYETAVAWAVGCGITVGTGENKFSPETVCDRAMCITLLYRLMGSPLDGIDDAEIIALDENTSLEDLTLEELGLAMTKQLVDSIREMDIFPDVPEGSYYELPVIWACLNEIITDDNTGKIEEGVLFRSLEPCVRKEMISFLYQTKLMQDAANAPAEIYFGDDLALPVPQEYFENEILAIDVYGLSEDMEDDGEDELALVVSEAASKEAAEAMGEENTDGIGELFRIIRVSEDRLHELLCSDMSGMNVFAKDKKDRYYIICYPTDVRYVRETNEKMNEDIEQWTALNEWARGNLGNQITAHSIGLSPVAFTNTDLDIYLARIAYANDIKYTVSTTEFGPLEPGKADVREYAEHLIGGNFTVEEDAEAPDGEYVVLNFPEEGVRFDFFGSDKDLVREVRDDYEVFYRCVYPDTESDNEIMQAWYDALAKQAGKK